MFFTFQLLLIQIINYSKPKYWLAVGMLFSVFQPVSLGLFRNDYMLDVKDSDTENDSLSQTPSLKQIEFNTIASSFGGLVSGMWQVHR